MFSVLEISAVTNALRFSLQFNEKASIVDMSFLHINIGIILGEMTSSRSCFLLLKSSVLSSITAKHAANLFKMVCSKTMYIS